jgi:DNA-binding transcriptional LysR family regulator
MLNFTKAAEACGIAQPTLTRSVKRLEEHFGGILLHREQRLTQLSDFGRLMLPLLEETVCAADTVEIHAKRYRRRDIASLRIGLLPSVSSGHLTQPLAELKLDIPNNRVEIIEGRY